MNVAIIGTGIAGLTAAHLLKDSCDLTIFEANDYIGGHTNTVNVEQQGRPYAVDTGFIVFNPHTYPNFIALMDKLGVAWRDTEMSFSVREDHTGLEYCGTNLNTLFAQRSNLLRLSFYRLLMEILRFNRRGHEYLGAGGDTLQGLEPATGQVSLGQFLARHGFSREFQARYLFPMAAAIWSADPAAIERFPAESFLRFFANHGLLSAAGHHTWRTIAGGSSSYIAPLVAPFRDRIRLRTPVRRILRDGQGVIVEPVAGIPARFDKVIIATHSDQALGMLGDPSQTEREVLGAITYQPNDVVLHTDSSLMPRNSRAWASWNYHIGGEPTDRATVTYDMNRLQGLSAPEPFLVTLNATERIDPAKILRRFSYDHPVFDTAAVQAQARHDEINGERHTYFCGAYWGNGFHEDGVNSALKVGESFGRSL